VGSFTLFERGLREYDDDIPHGAIAASLWLATSHRGVSHRIRSSSEKNSAGYAQGDTLRGSPVQAARNRRTGADARGRGAHEGALEIAPTGVARNHRRRRRDTGADAMRRGAHEGALEITPTGVARNHRRRRRDTGLTRGGAERTRALWRSPLQGLRGTIDAGGEPRGDDAGGRKKLRPYRADAVFYLLSSIFSSLLSSLLPLTFYLLPFTSYLSAIKKERQQGCRSFFWGMRCGLIQLCRRYQAR
jgi:hypothetical protein